MPFAKPGGAGMGYKLAGFTVIGIDIEPQPNYPFEFVCGDALDYIKMHGHKFHLIHTSPPCQGYSATKTLTTKDYPKLIKPLRKILLDVGVPYVIENVRGAPLINPTLLCGAMFGLGTYRHRLFETSFPLPLIMHPGHGAKQDKLSGPSCERKQEMVVVVGKPGYKGASKRYREAMEINWMTDAEITEAIPPAYTEWIGNQFIRHITTRGSDRATARANNGA